MPRVIFKCPYVKIGASSGGYVSYIATREGAEPVSGYVGYIATRQNAHGLFSATGPVADLEAATGEVAAHPGRVWLPIISLTREDAERLGYDNANSWQTFLSGYANTLAANMKIPPESFRWYGAFHDEGSHPHVHMVCYSSDPSEGYLSKQGIQKIKSGLAATIFRQELTALYREQTQRRDELTQTAQTALADLIQAGVPASEDLLRLTAELSERLAGLPGKKQYGYLPAPLKKLVDEIVDELARDERVAGAYKLWCQLRMEVLRTYRDELEHPGPLSAQKELKRIRNIVVEECIREAAVTEVKSVRERTGENGSKTGESIENASVERDLDSKPVFPSEEQCFLPERFLRPASPLNLRAAQSILVQLARLLQDTAPAPQTRPGLTDSKLRRKLREKKLAQGHAEQEHMIQT